MTTIDDTLEKFMELDIESREMMIEIAQKRQIEEKRIAIAHNAQQAISDYKNNNLKGASAAEIILKLNSLA